jgi:enoyl-CoA hydratase
VQVLRSTALLPAAQALDVESMAFSTLQGGEEFAAWMRTGKRGPPLPVQAGDPVLLSRDGAVIEAILNRAGTRNAISVEMRDAWVEALQLLEADESVEELRFRALGACFSAGGELHEFGLAPDPATAHWVRTVHSPARLLARLGARVSFFVHGACIGSGIELPAFAARLVAHPDTFFQLPELQMGLIPGAGGTVSIARRIGRQRTAWMVLTGRRITARTALEWGLVDELADRS